MRCTKICPLTAHALNQSDVAVADPPEVVVTIRLTTEGDAAVSTAKLGIKLQNVIGPVGIVLGCTVGVKPQSAVYDLTAADRSPLVQIAGEVVGELRYRRCGGIAAFIHILVSDRTNHNIVEVGTVSGREELEAAAGEVFIGSFIVQLAIHIDLDGTAAEYQFIVMLTCQIRADMGCTQVCPGSTNTLNQSDITVADPPEVIVTVGLTAERDAPVSAAKLGIKFQNIISPVGIVLGYAVGVELQSAVYDLTAADRSPLAQIAGEVIGELRCRIGYRSYLHIVKVSRTAICKQQDAAIGEIAAGTCIVQSSINICIDLSPVHFQLEVVDTAEALSGFHIGDITPSAADALDHLDVGVAITKPPEIVVAAAFLAAERDPPVGSTTKVCVELDGIIGPLFCCIQKIAARVDLNHAVFDLGVACMPFTQIPGKIIPQEDVLRFAACMGGQDNHRQHQCQCKH